MGQFIVTFTATKIAPRALGESPTRVHGFEVEASDVYAAIQSARERLRADGEDDLAFPFVYAVPTT